MTTTKMYRIIITYNMATDPTNMQSYYRFVMGRYVPSLDRLGLRLIEAWSPAYGDEPDRQLGFLASSMEIALSAVNSNIWQSLEDEFLEFIEDFECRIIPYKEGFQT